jgi:hypothetical protein
MKSFRLFALLAVAMFVASSAEAKLFGGCGLFGGHKSCCEPVCCEAEPTCCEAEPVCCEEAAPVCEEAPAPCCEEAAPAPCCEEAAPVCCEEPAPCCEEAPVCCEEPACCPKKHCFLSKLFGRFKHNDCCCN